jgi:D-sedoheptulose 7-phosphate isomerase
MATSEEKQAQIKKKAEDAAILCRSMAEQLSGEIVSLADLMSGVIGTGGKIMLAANGPLAGIVSSFVAELVTRAARDRNRQALPAIALSANPSVMTAAADQFGYEYLYARQVDGLGHKGDMLIVLSTDGGTVNLVRAVQAAREKNIITCALLGGNGGELAKLADRVLIAAHPSSQRTQEEHLFILHMLVDLLEGDLFA